MKVIIDIPEKAYKVLKSGKGIDWLSYLYADDLSLYVINCTPLPKGHGRLIDADKCIRQAWNDFYKHEEEWEKKDKDYLPFGRFYDQNGFECCLKTIGKSSTIIEADTESEDQT